MNKLIQTKPVALLLIALLAALAYSNTFSASFHFDDIQNIIENSKIRSLENFSDFFNSRYVGSLSFALNYHFGGLQVFGYHLVNLLIHIANGFLVYSLALLLLEAINSPRSENAPLIALATALLFVAHPIQTQAVTYIVQRFASLMTLFYLLAVVGYLKWRLGGREGWGGIRILWYAGGLLSALLAMRTKENSFTLPFMILLVEWVFFTRKRWVAVIPFLLTLFIIPISYSGAIGEGEAGLFRDTMEISRSEYLFTQFRVIMTYLRLLILPVHQNLDYDYPIYRSLFVPSVFLSFLFLSSLFVLAIYLLRRAIRQPSPVNPQFKLIGFGILWFFLTQSIESSIIPIRDVIFEHRVYLPSVGIFLAVCTVWSFLLSSRRTIGLLSMVSIILIFSAATYQRNKIWQNDEMLWKDVVKKSPNKARPHNNVGNAYKNLKRPEEAKREYQTALGLDPNIAETHYNLGNIHGDQGYLEEAIREYRIALQLKPEHAKAHNNLGNIYGAQERLEDSVREYQTAIRFQPDYAAAYNNLANDYQRLGRFEEAIPQYQNAIRLHLDSAEIRFNLATAYKSLGRLEEAAREYRIVLRLQPNFPEVRQALEALQRQ